MSEYFRIHWRYSLLSQNTQLVTVISLPSSIYVWKREREGEREGEGEAASRPVTLLGEERDWGILSTVESISSIPRELEGEINMRKGESKASNWDEPKHREAVGAGAGRIEKHVRVLSLWGKALLDWDLRKISMVRPQRSLHCPERPKGGVVGLSLPQPYPVC